VGEGRGGLKVHYEGHSGFSIGGQQGGGSDRGKRQAFEKKGILYTRPTSATQNPEYKKFLEGTDTENRAAKRKKKTMYTDNKRRTCEKKRRSDTHFQISIRYSRKSALKDNQPAKKNGAGEEKKSKKAITRQRPVSAERNGGQAPARERAVPKLSEKSVH